MAASATHSTLVSLLRDRAASAPERAAFDFLGNGDEPSERATYADLDRRARAIGARLRSLGAAPGERALLVYPPGLDFVAGFFGCLYGGLTAVPIYPPNPAHLELSLERYRAVAADAAPAAVLTTSAVHPLLELAGAGARREVPRLATDLVTPDEAEAWSPPGGAGEGAALIQYTSGSTGAPRGVVLSHASLLANVRAIHEGFGLRPDDVAVSWLPLYHDMGLIGGVLTTIEVGARSVLLSPIAFLERPRRWLRAIARSRGTVSTAPNFAYDLCARRGSPEQRAGLDLSSWRLALTGSEAVRSETIERFTAAFAPCGFQREAFRPCYGLAEASLFVSGGRGPRTLAVDRRALEVGEARDAAGAAMAGGGRGATRTLVSVGPPAPGTRIAIADPATGTPLPDGAVGEIRVAGPGVGCGYWGRPEESGRTFGEALADGSAPGGGPWLRTGDLGFLRDGELYVAGRLKDLIIVRGRNHDPEDIERTVEAAHLALRPSCAAAFPIEADGEERLAIAVEVRSALVPDAAAVAGAIRRAVSERHEVQAYAVALLEPGGIPKTSSGKVRRSECREALLAARLPIYGRTVFGSVAGIAPAFEPRRPASAAAARAPAQTAGSEIERRILALVAAVSPHAPPGGLRLEHHLTADLGFDSLLMVELATKVAAAYPEAREIPGRALTAGLTVGELARHVARAVEARAPVASGERRSAS